MSGKIVCENVENGQQYETLKSLTIPVDADVQIKQIGKTDGYDGHSLRAYYYFTADMPDIDPNSVSSINSISQKYPKLRQASKGPTFCLTYGGTRYALVDTCGLPLDTAIQIESNYHTMYSVSDKWVADRIEQASKDGFVTVAFGLRVRTPKLKSSIVNTSKTPPDVQAEGRTAGNALGQSYGMLNNRAGIEFQERVLNSRFKNSILPVLQVHDSQYFLIKNDIQVLRWFNENLVQCMEWQELPEIQHETVKLGGDIELYHPSWAYSFTIPNNASRKQILDITKGKNQ